MDTQARVTENKMSSWNKFQLGVERKITNLEEKERSF